MKAIDINIGVAYGMEKMILDFNAALERVVTYKRLQGRSNDPYEKVGIAALIAEEQREAVSLQRTIAELKKQL